MLNKGRSILDQGFNELGLNTYWNITSVTDPLTEARDVATSFYDNARSNNPNTFSEAGFGIGSVVGSFAAGGFAIKMAMNDKKQYNLRGHGYQDTVKMNLSDDLFLKKRSGDLIHSSGLRVNDTQSKFIKKNSSAGLMKGGHFVKNPKIWKGFAGMFGSVAAGMVLGSGLSVAGSFLDDAAQDDRNRRQMSYDTRYFNTSKYEQSAYDTIGSAMDSMESRMISTARIYHSRG